MTQKMREFDKLPPGLRFRISQSRVNEGSLLFFEEVIEDGVRYFKLTPGADAAMFPIHEPDSYLVHEVRQAILRLIHG